MILRITAAYIRTYSDTGQTLVYVEWVDRKGSGVTVGRPNNAHMLALLQRARREGVDIERQRW